MSEVITLITNGIYISSVSPKWLTTVNPATWWYALSVLKQRWYTPRTGFTHSDLFKRYFILHPYCSKHFVALRMIWCHQNKSSLQYSLIIPKALKLIKWKKKWQTISWETLQIAWRKNNDIYYEDLHTQSGMKFANLNTVQIL